MRRCHAGVRWCIRWLAGRHGRPAARAGRDRTSRGRLALTDEGQDFFETITAGREGDKLVFTKTGEKPWGHMHQQQPMRKACQRVGITPLANFHVLRHTYDSLLVMAGVPLVVVAKNLGHSDTRMCERHYAHLAPSYVADTIRAHAPKLGITEPGKVTPLKINTAANV